MYLNVKENVIYYEKHGTGKNIFLILPGWGNTRETFTYIINSLKVDNTVYIIDYPGLGNSPIPKHTLTIYDYTEIIIDFMTQLHIINPTIIAHSFGGRIAALLCGYYKRPIKKLILMDVAGIKKKTTIKTKIYKLLKILIKVLPTNLRKKCKKKLFNHFASTDYLNLPPTMHETFKNIIKEDLKKYYKNIKEETILIWGELDKDTPLKDGKKIKRLIKNSALITYQYAHHFSYLTYPLLTVNIIKEFTKKEHQ